MVKVDVRSMLELSTMISTNYKKICLSSVFFLLN